MNNHNTENCYYNKKNKNKKNKNYKKQNSNYRRKNYSNKRKHIGYINNDNKDEIYSSSNESVLYINNIYKNDKLNNINENYTYWIYDTGAAEHITNNKNILKNFTNKKIMLKCANNTMCEFQGYGTYEGKINNQNIKLKNVWYSEQIAMNLISGIKLAESGIICKINKESFKPQLEIKNNWKLIFKTYVNKHNNFKIKTTNKIYSKTNKINEINCINKNFSNKI